MTRSRIAAVGLVVASLTCAAAQARAAGFESRSANDEEKSPAVAAALAGGAAVVGYGTAVGLAVGTDFEPAALFFTSAALGVFGPSTGHIYAGRNPAHPVLFSLGRLAFIAIALAGVAEGISHDDGQTGPADKGKVQTMIGVGIAGIAGLTIWEVADSYACAKQTHRAPATPSRTLSLAPFFAPSRSAGGSSSGGLLLSGRF
jgi:hypothetical protein